MKQLGMDARCLAGVKIASVGPATSDALKDNFLQADLVPETFTSAALGEALAATAAAGTKLLLARADIATNDLPDILRAAGAEVAEAVAYRTVPPDGLAEDAAEALAAGTVNWVTFTSSSTAENFLALAKANGHRRRRSSSWLRSARSPAPRSRRPGSSRPSRPSSTPSPAWWTQSCGWVTSSQ